MARTVAIGKQDFEIIRENVYFYVDKTKFIHEWWEGGDATALETEGIPAERIRKYGFAFEGY